jgi:hypothetical protein
MLHALLRGKLLASAPEPQRLEDALTSTVFGTLLMVEAVEVLHEWMSSARDAQGRPAPKSPLRGACEAWFWPGLTTAEPDVVLCLGSRVYVVEAKYRADRHDGLPVETDLLEDGDEPVLDQLKRQWQSVEHIRNGVGRGPDSLLAAVSRCDATFIFLVDQRRMRTARREYLESLDVMHGADLRLLTWQELYRILREAVHRETRRWVVDLIEFLDRAGLDSFCGISQFPPDVATCSDRVRSWRSVVEGPEWGLRHSIERVLSLKPGARRAIVEWRRRETGSGTAHEFRWIDVMAPVTSGPPTLLAARIASFRRGGAAGREEDHG